MVARPGQLQVSFNSGEISPELVYRADLKTFYASAEEMINAEPVPQGGFRLMPGTVDLGPVRNPMTLVGFSSQVVNSGPFSFFSVLFQGNFSVATRICAVWIDGIFGPVALENVIQVQYLDAISGLWINLGLPFDLATTAKNRVAALPPGQTVSALAVRLVYLGSSLTWFGLFNARAYDESASFTPNVRIRPFTFARDQNYIMVFSSGCCDIYRDGAYVGSAFHGMPDTAILEMKHTQRLDTMLLFHRDYPDWIIKRERQDHQWNFTLLVYDDVPNVDLGGVYAKQADYYNIYITYTSATNPSEIQIVFSANGEETSAIPMDGANVSGYGAAVAAALEALPSVSPGLTHATNISGTITRTTVWVQIGFTGVGNIGDRFTFSARTVGAAVDVAVNVALASKADPGGEPLWSSTRGYASCGAFFQDRLTRGGFRSKPGSLLLSPTGDYFTGGIEIEAATGGILNNLDTDGAERIQDLGRSKHLLLFTDKAEYFISNRAITRTEALNIVESSRNGSTAFVPIVSSENSVFYAAQNRALVYAATYSDVAQAYESTPITLLASHLTYDLWDAALQKAERNIDAGRYFLLRQDGVLVVGILLRDQDVQGFCQWRTPGNVYALCVDGMNRPFMVVERIVNGQPRRRLEIMESGQLLHGAVTRSSAPSTVVTGLSMHEGASVWAIADGIVRGPFTVTGGTLTLPVAASTVTVGRWIAPRVKSLPLPRMQADRIALRRPGRIHGVNVSVLGTSSMAIGANEVAPRDIDLTRYGTAPLTGDVRVAGLAGWNEDCRLLITQMRPGALQVRGVTLEARL
jgi:hypothetical protein